MHALEQEEAGDAAEEEGQRAEEGLDGEHEHSIGIVHEFHKTHCPPDKRSAIRHTHAHTRERSRCIYLTRMQ